MSANPFRDWIEFWMTALATFLVTIIFFGHYVLKIL